MFVENIMWLTVDNIQEKESTVISEIPQLPNMVGSGVSVGAVVSDTVGAVSVGENSPLQVSFPQIIQAIINTSSILVAKDSFTM